MDKNNWNRVPLDNGTPLPPPPIEFQGQSTPGVGHVYPLHHQSQSQGPVSVSVPPYQPQLPYVFNACYPEGSSPSLSLPQIPITFPPREPALRSPVDTSYGYSSSHPQSHPHPPPPPCFGDNNVPQTQQPHPHFQGQGAVFTPSNILSPSPSSGALDYSSPQKSPIPSQNNIYAEGRALLQQHHRRHHQGQQVPPSVSVIQGHSEVPTSSPLQLHRPSPSQVQVQPLPAFHNLQGHDSPQVQAQTQAQSSVLRFASADGGVSNVNFPVVTSKASGRRRLMIVKNKPVPDKPKVDYHPTPPPPLVELSDDEGQSLSRSLLHPKSVKPKPLKEAVPERTVAVVGSPIPPSSESAAPETQKVNTSLPVYSPTFREVDAASRSELFKNASYSSFPGFGPFSFNQQQPRPPQVSQVIEEELPQPGIGGNSSDGTSSSPSFLHQVLTQGQGAQNQASISTPVPALDVNVEDSDIDMGKVPRGRGSGARRGRPRGGRRGTSGRGASGVSESGRRGPVSTGQRGVRGFRRGRGGRGSRGSSKTSTTPPNTDCSETSNDVSNSNQSPETKVGKRLRAYQRRTPSSPDITDAVYRDNSEDEDEGEDEDEDDSDDEYRDTISPPKRRPGKPRTTVKLSQKELTNAMRKSPKVEALPRNFSFTDIIRTPQFINIKRAEVPLPSPDAKGTQEDQQGQEPSQSQSQDTDTKEEAEDLHQAVDVGGEQVEQSMENNSNSMLVEEPEAGPSKGDSQEEAQVPDRVEEPDTVDGTKGKEEGEPADEDEDVPYGSRLLQKKKVIRPTSRGGKRGSGRRISSEATSSENEVTRRTTRSKTANQSPGMSESQNKPRYKDTSSDESDHEHLKAPSRGRRSLYSVKSNDEEDEEEEDDQDQIENDNLKVEEQKAPESTALPNPIIGSGHPEGLIFPESEKPDEAPRQFVRARPRRVLDRKMISAPEPSRVKVPANSLSFNLSRFLLLRGYTPEENERLYGDRMFLIDILDMDKTPDDMFLWQIMKPEGYLLQYVPVKFGGRQFHVSSVTRWYFMPEDFSTKEFYDKFQPIAVVKVREKEVFPETENLKPMVDTTVHFLYSDKASFNRHIRKLGKIHKTEHLREDFLSMTRALSVMSIYPEIGELILAGITPDQLPPPFRDFQRNLWPAKERIREYIHEVVTNAISSSNFTQETIMNVMTYPEMKYSRKDINQRGKNEMCSACQPLRRVPTVQVNFAPSQDSPLAPYNPKTLQELPEDKVLLPARDFYYWCHDCSGALRKLHRLAHFIYCLYRATMYNLSDIALQLKQHSGGRKVTDEILFWALSLEMNYFCDQFLELQVCIAQVEELFAPASSTSTSGKEAGRDKDASKSEEENQKEDEN